MIHAQIFNTAVKAYMISRLKTKLAHYKNGISEAAGDQGALIPIPNQFLQRGNAAPLPNHDSPEVLANNFIQFFNNKVNNTQTSLSLSTPPGLFFPEPIPGSSFTNLVVITGKEVAELIKESLINPGPIIQHILPNSGASLNAHHQCITSEWVVLNCVKEAHLTPILKKYNLDVEVLNKYRPISNFSYH